MAVNAFIQFGGYTPVNTFKNWNHANSVSTGTIIADMVDENGTATGWSLFYDAAEQPTQQSNSGINSVGTGDAAWVDEDGIGQTFHYAQNGHTAVSQFRGLDDAKTYDIEFYSSWNSGSGSRRAEISVDNFTTTAVVQAQGNTTEVARLAGVTPTSGVIALSWRSLDDDSHAHCNAVWIRENDAAGGTTITAGTDGLTITEQNAGISLDSNIPGGTDSLTISGLGAALSLGKGISAGKDSLAITEIGAAMSLDTDIASGVDSLTITERQAAIVLNEQGEILAGTDSLNITELRASIERAGEICRYSVQSGLMWT